MAKTQILATIGPASEKRIKQLFEAGVSGIRINSSHGSFEEHAKIIKDARKYDSSKFIVYDVKGPKIRLGDFKTKQIKHGDSIIIRTDLKAGSNEYARTEDIKSGIPITYEDMHLCVKKGDKLLVDDGTVGLEVQKVVGQKIHTKVLYGRVLLPRKGVNHPDTIIDFPDVLDSDIKNIHFAVKQKPDYLAGSFIRSKRNVEALKELLKGTKIKIISKIENPEGLDNIDDIIKVSDIIMIARGDLGIEIEPWNVPEWQKEIIEKCHKAKKRVIVATEMLESMIQNPFPSRSDVSDIANAVYDGTDCLMLSGETASGHYPEECVRMMKKIAEVTEKTNRYKKLKYVVKKF